MGNSITKTTFIIIYFGIKKFQEKKINLIFDILNTQHMILIKSFLRVYDLIENYMDPMRHLEKYSM